VTTAVIITTYNQLRWLEKVLWGYAAQDRADFTVVIADDGSATPTRAVIETARSYFGKRLKHVWHEDVGFRKCEILNRAITVTDADYLIFTDGDCVPRADFVSTHIELAEPKRFLSGGVVWLPKVTSEAITRADVLNGRMAQAKWLRAHGWRGGRRRLRLVRNEIAATVLDTVSPQAQPSTATTLPCGAMGCWR
jgi:glycosyltransferase involved in cell wall biosynthesis